MKLPRRGERGFTLVETMVSLLVFALVTVGLVPLFATSLRGSTLARSYTVGKNTATQAMERVRGLPFFVSYASKNRRVDVLDLYYPNLTGGYAANSYTTTCTATTVNPACPANIPQGMSVLYKATFVRTSTYSSVPIRYDIVAPPAGYRWDSATGADLPPSQLVEVLVRTSWNVGGETKTYELKTLIADRKVGTTRVRGTARVDYGAQVLTSYDVAGVKSDLSLTAATGESKVETKLLSGASQSVGAGTIRLIRASDDPTVLGSDLGTSPKLGAETSLHAPPDSTPLGASVGAQILTHPDWLVSGVEKQIAYMDDTNTSGLKAAVANELPTSTGSTKNSNSSGYAAWVDNQANRDQSASTIHQLHTTDPMFQIAAAGQGIKADTTATTTSTTAADRKVETIADTKLGDVRILPVNYITGADRSVIRITDFKTTATCKATASSATSVATGSWSATLRYWRDNNPNDGGTAAGSYTSVVLNSASLGTILADLQAVNPLVLDKPSADKDIYLFQTGLVNGYFTSMSATAPIVTKSADGRTTTVNIDGALRLQTVPTDPLNSATALSISLGKLSCEAVDNR